MLILHVTSLQFSLYSLILITYQRIFTRIYRGTHTQAHMYDQHTRGMATTRHRSLVGRGGRKGFLRGKGLVHSKQKLSAGKTRYLESKTDFVHIELPAKLLRSNESNINQEINFALLKAIKIPSYMPGTSAWGGFLPFNCAIFQGTQQAPRTPSNIIRGLFMPC